MVAGPSVSLPLVSVGCLEPALTREVEELVERALAVQTSLDLVQAVMMFQNLKVDMYITQYNHVHIVHVHVTCNRYK